MSTPSSCSVCGRTILKGERTRTYLTPDDERRTVCELCRAQAESLRWVWAEAVAENPLPRERRRRRSSLVGWLRGLAPRAAHAETAQEPPSSSDSAPDSVAPPNREKASANPAGLAGSAGPDPAARGARVGRAGAIAEPATRVERAMARFNESAQARTVAGLMKTLGEPRVSIGAAAGSPNEVRLTVAWELSWYQWGVDLSEPSRAVYEIDKGYEVDEIDASAREWNAHADKSGALRMGSDPERREGEPARTES